MFSDNLKKIMQEKNENVPTVSNETGIPVTTLYDWVHGRSLPPADKLKVLAIHFEKTADELLE